MNEQERKEKIKKGYELINDVANLPIPHDYHRNSLLRDLNIYIASLRFLEKDTHSTEADIRGFLSNDYRITRILDYHDWDHYSRELKELKDWILTNIKGE